MKKIKILRIIARLNIGGPAIHAVLLIQGLDKNRFESLLVCGRISPAEGDMFYYAVEKGVQPYFISEIQREPDFIKDVIAFKKIYNIIRKEKPDIVHTHTAKAGFLGRLAGIVYNFFTIITYKKRTKLIHTFHGHIFSGYFNKFQTRLFVYIERFLALFTSKIITVSEANKNGLVSLGICPPRKVQVIPLGFELGEFLSIPIADRDIAAIGIIGRLVPIKNHRLFLESAARVIKDNPQKKLRFKIIGDGELREDLEGYSHKLELDGKLEFLGWQRDLARIYSDLDIVCLTSLNEGTPVSLIEAMACARAVVATEVGGVPDLLGEEITTGIKQSGNFKILERGITVASPDADSFSAAINFMLQDTELRKNMCLGARKYVEGKFTKKRLISDIERLYEAVTTNIS